MKKLMLLLVLLCACENASPVKKHNEEEEQIHYFKDTRTGLCFATGWGGGGYGGPVFTNVPCTPAVEKMLELKSYSAL